MVDQLVIVPYNGVKSIAKEVDDMDRFTKGFFSDLGERTIATFAQALLGVLGGAGLGLIEVDWVAALSVAGLAALLAVLKGFAGDLANAETGASWGTATPVDSVAATETPTEGRYEAGAAAPVEEGTPVDVVPEGALADTGDTDEPYGFDHSVRD